MSSQCVEWHDMRHTARSVCHHNVSNDMTWGIQQVVYVITMCRMIWQCVACGAWQSPTKIFNEFCSAGSFRQIQTAVWNLASFLHCALETRWQQFGQFLSDFLNDFLNDFLHKNLNFLYENVTFSLWKILVIFSMIVLMIHKICYCKIRVSTVGVETRWLGWQFLNG